MAIPAVNDALARVGLSAAPRSVEPAGQGEDLEVAPQLIPGTALENVPVYADTHGGDAPLEHRASSIEQYQGAVDAGEQLTGGQS
jgi:hypothetical protein